MQGSSTRRRSGTTCAGGPAISFYLDASLVVSTLAEDEFTRRASAWLGQQSPDALRTSAWLAVEVRAALADKLRRRLLTDGERDEALRLLEGLMAGTERTELRERDFRRAAALCDRQQLGLRAPDALHLATCEAGGHVMCTYDKTLAAAAEAIGVLVEQP